MTDKSARNLYQKETKKIQQPMTKSINRTKIQETDHTKFGGLIFPSDFNTDYRGKSSKNGSAIANRIASDYKFDEQCRKNHETFNKAVNGGQEH